MQALREQVSVAPRYMSQPPSPRPMLSRSSPTRAPRANVSHSRALSALATMTMNPGVSTAGARPAQPLLFPYNPGQQQSPNDNTAPPSSSRGAATLSLSTTPAMGPSLDPPPAWRNVTRAHVTSDVPSETEAAMPVKPADVTESEPVPAEAPVEEDISMKPLYSYRDYTPEPTRVYTHSVSEVNDYLPLFSGPLGFDMEWKVSFRLQQASSPTAVVQICDEKYIWVIQVSLMRSGFPSALQKILEDPDVPKIGVNIRNDAKKLYRDFGVKMQNLVELSYMSRQADKDLRLGGKLHARTFISLQNLVGRYLDKHLFKDSVRLSDWEAKLSDEQLDYAANDAHCALQLYKQFLSTAENDEITLTPDWYTLRIGEGGECTFKVEPPAPVGTSTKKAAAKGKDAVTTQASQESVTPRKAEKPKRVKGKAPRAPRAPSSRSLKTSPSLSSSESSKSSTSSWPPIRPSARTRKTRQPDIVEISDSDTGADKSTLSNNEPTSTSRSRASPPQTPRYSPALPRTAVISRSSPFGDAAFSGRGWERFYFTDATTVATASSGNAFRQEPSGP